MFPYATALADGFRALWKDLTREGNPKSFALQPLTSVTTPRQPRARSTPDPGKRCGHASRC
jgi:hypothetical protein